MHELNDPKQELFCQLYVVYLDATRAAREAGFGGENPSSVPNAAHRLRNDEKVKLRIAELVKGHAEDMLVNDQYVLRKLKIIADAKIEDYIDIVVQTVMQDANGDVPAQVMQVNEIIWKPFDKLTPEQKGAIQSVRSNRSGIEIKLYDKSWSLDMIAKHIGFYERDNKQKVETGVQIVMPHNGRESNPTGDGS